MNTAIYSEIKRTDTSRIATNLNVSYDYVIKVLRGDRNANSAKAKAIVKAMEILEASRKSDVKKLQKIKNELELEGE